MEVAEGTCRPCCRLKQARPEVVLAGECCDTMVTCRGPVIVRSSLTQVARLQADRARSCSACMHGLECGVCSQMTVVEAVDGMEALICSCQSHCHCQSASHWAAFAKRHKHMLADV